MKKILFTLTFTFIFVSFVSAQGSINVQITDECQPVSGTYNFLEVTNAKNSYLQNLVIDGNNITIYVTFDGLKWVLHNGDITDTGYINYSVPNSVYPPETGWEPTGCNFGTMIITNSLANSLFVKEDVSIFPNPVNTTFEINSPAINFSNFEIIDHLGRSILTGNVVLNNKINVESLSKGNYIIKLTNDNKKYFYVKIIKN